MKKFKHAARGIARAFFRESSLKIHAFAAVIVIAAAVFLRVSAPEFCVLLICIALVISLELVNTALERLCDKLHPERDGAIGAAKDAAAGAVLVAALISAAVGLIIFIPYIKELLTS